MTENHRRRMMMHLFIFPSRSIGLWARRIGIMIMSLGCIFVSQTFGDWVVKDITPQNQKELDTKVEVFVDPVEPVTNVLANANEPITNSRLHVVITVLHSGSLKRFSHAALEIGKDKTNLLIVQPIPIDKYAWLTRYGFVIDTELGRTAQIRLMLDGYEENDKINEFVVRLKDFYK